MPSIEHELLVDLIRERPEVTVPLLHDKLGVELPGFKQVRLEAADLTDVRPTEYRADAVVTFRGPERADKPVLGVVVEIQLNRDGDKRWVWPVYVATLRARLRCPVLLLVVCPNAAVAAWCGAPIEIGHPGWVLSPLVLGPDRVPVVTDIEQVAGVVELMLLSAVAHGTHPNHKKILNALAFALSTDNPDRAVRYAEIASAVLPEPARPYWEELMTAQTFEFQSAYARRLKAEGKAEGKAEAEATAVLAVLDARGIEVPDDVRTRITACSDLDQLLTWVRRAATADAIEDLFE
jgi:hypothetical protein